MKIEISTNAASVLDILKKTPEYATARVKQAVTDGCLIVEADAKKKVVVDTGRLRSSITHEVEAVTGEPIVGKIGSNVLYAPYIEYGTGRAGAPYPPEAIRFKTGKESRGRIARPYLYPALAENFLRITNIITEAVLDALNSVHKAQKK
jgi:hypothetical protein